MFVTNIGQNTSKPLKKQVATNKKKNVEFSSEKNESDTFKPEEGNWEWILKEEEWNVRI